MLNEPIKIFVATRAMTDRKSGFVKPISNLCSLAPVPAMNKLFLNKIGVTS